MTEPSRTPADSSALQRQFQSLQFRLWLGITTLLTGALMTLPLFGIIGYELALAVAPVGALCGLHVGNSRTREAQKVASGDQDLAHPRRVRMVTTFVLHGAAAPLALMSVPVICAAIHGVWTQTCDWWFGLTAYVWLPVTSTLLGSMSGVALALWIGPRRWLGAFAPWLLALILALEGMLRFYGAPAVFSYTPLLGFFPGNLYDEEILLSPALYWARLEQLSVVLTALAGATALLDTQTLRVRFRHRPPASIDRSSVGFASITASIAIALAIQSGALGYRVGVADVRSALGGVHHTPHFTIYFADLPALRDEISRYGEDHELRLTQVCTTLELDCAKLHIDSYVFASDQQKGELMGARRVEMAKPWRREIYLTVEPFPHSSLRHEIAHVVAAEFGSPWFRVSARSVLGLPLLFNPGMIEGLAVAADWPGRSRSMTPHQAMRALDELGMAPAADAVLSVKFLTLASARGYTAAGSFVRFLLDRYGAAAVRALYRSGGDFEAVLGRRQALFVDEWRAMLGGIAVPATVRETVREQYRRPGVFSRACPHAVANRLSRAQALMTIGEPEPAIRLVRSVCGEVPEEPTYRLHLADLLDDGAPPGRAEARAIYQSIVEENLGAVLSSEALAGLIGLEDRSRDLANLGRLVDAALALPLDDERRRPFEAMKVALHASGLGGTALRLYFFGTRARDPNVNGQLTWARLAAITGDRESRGLGWYLVGLQLDDGTQPAATAAALSMALSVGLPSSRFVRAGTRRLLVAAWRAKQPARVEQAIQLLEHSTYEVDRLLGADWRERVAFTSR